MDLVTMARPVRVNNEKILGKLPEAGVDTENTSNRQQIVSHPAAKGDHRAVVSRNPASGKNSISSGEHRRQIRGYRNMFESTAIYTREGDDRTVCATLNFPGLYLPACTGSLEARDRSSLQFWLSTRLSEVSTLFSQAPALHLTQIFSQRSGNWVLVILAITESPSRPLQIWEVILTLFTGAKPFTPANGLSFLVTLRSSVAGRSSN